MPATFTLDVSPNPVQPGENITVKLVLDIPERPSEAGITVTFGFVGPPPKPIDSAVIDLDGNGHWEGTMSYTIPQSASGTYQLQAQASKEGFPSMLSNIVALQIGVSPPLEALPLAGAITLAAVDLILLGVYAGTKFGLIKLP